jgi:glutamyl-tRNA reductase
MDRIGILGLSWRHFAPEQLAPWTLPHEQRGERLPALAAAIGVRELVYVATCNRVEIAFVAAPATPLSSYRPRVWRALRGADPAPGAAERTLRAWGGEGAVEHLLLVTAGLDSARVGETEIAAQVRAAYDLSRELGLAGPRLARVCDEALRVAKRVHALTEIGTGHVSLAENALELLRAARGARTAPIALLGVSPMTLRAGRDLAAAGVELLCVNRTLSKALDLARELGAQALSLEEFAAAPPPVSAVLAATGSQTPILSRAALERLARAARQAPDAATAAGDACGQRLCIVDMGVPANVDPSDAAAAGLERVGMDELAAHAARQRDARLALLGDARSIVDAALAGIARKLSERRLGPMQAALHERFRVTAVEKAEQLLRSDFAELDAARGAALRAFAETLARHLAHVPSAGLRELAERNGMEAVESFFASADPHLRAILERVLADETLPRAVRDEEAVCD